MGNLISILILIGLMFGLTHLIITYPADVLIINISLGVMYLAGGIRALFVK